MKYYKNSKIKKDKFITNYNANDKKITVHYANKKALEYPYSDGLKSMIEKRMTLQVVSAHEDDLKDTCIDLKVLTIALPLILVSYGISFAVFTSSFIMLILSLIVTAGVTIACTKILDKKEHVVDDIKKYKLFIENDELLNKSVTNDEVKKFVPRKQQIMINRKIKTSNLDDKEKIFSFQTLDNYSYEELQALKNAITAYRYTDGYDETSTDISQVNDRAFKKTRF